MSRSSAVQSLPEEQPVAAVLPDTVPDGPSFASLFAFQTDNVLRNRESIYAQIAERRDLKTLIAVSLAMTAVFGGAYGAMAGLYGGMAQALSSAVKVPLLLIASLAAVAPPLYAFNTLIGSRIRGVQLAALAAATVATTSVILLALAPFALFLNFTGISYPAMKLSLVGLFFVAGYCGAYFLYEGMQTVAARLGQDQNLPLLQVWLCAYAYVSVQMAWMLRPFLGDPARPFAFVRPLSGSFFKGVLDALYAVLR